ncbi:hypothetical protein PCANC_11200 [Puccinia coronata f. sp. avenae]|uniref:Extracellular membrane protein CFEM domain-containing protein n=1 Tax=Puccinia coronata f. sp. avenae TaxID=200324 RepID=A0A2N5V8U9_9BASI|nr:hypothetical protein PCANC_11200 [Puccinia coronata f. sp. avenae]
MQIATIFIVAILATLSAASPAADVHQQLQPRARCGTLHPACDGGSKIGQAQCVCRSQRQICDSWSCPGSTVTTMVCGADESGCAYTS